MLVLYAIGFAFAAVATAIADALPLWGSLLIVSGALALAAIVIAYTAKRVAKTASPPRPVATVEESQKTAKALRRHA